jgi:hypothetical protein
MLVNTSLRTVNGKSYEKKLKRKKCAISMDSFNKQTIFFINLLDGSGVIPLSAFSVPKKNDQCNLLYGSDRKTFKFKSFSLPSDQLYDTYDIT